ncbi:MAG: ferritin-like domain-containing protein [Leptolyngbyaceae cyanobacterium MO_188.B28]|nr:ferritin-like domain-containing protein [Leptolyngbyaceae cyanobacterium MO_188.B28]
MHHKFPSDGTEYDLAGQFYASPNYHQIQSRINCLVDIYIADKKLSDRLQDLPGQFENPQPRPWKPIDWRAVQADQIVGVDPAVFVSILAGTIDTEAPIRGYTQTSRQYLEKLYPKMARFVGGVVNEQGSIVEIGLWEKEERQHAPALLKVYTQLAGEKFICHPHQARGYCPSLSPQADLYRHGLHRVATEYGATCLYTWLMAHSTGPLQAVLEELLKDEINHMTKFWGFGMWAFPNSSVIRIIGTLGRAMKRKLADPTVQGSLIHTLGRMKRVLNWPAWSLTNKTTFLFTFDQIMRRLWRWNTSLTPDYLNHLFGERRLSWK